MSAAQMEPVDEFAPASAGIEEGRYLLRYQKCFETNGQYGKQNVHILELAEIEGESIRFYCDPKMAKGSQQRNMIEAFLGRELAEGEQVTPRMLKAREAYGDVELNKNDKPKIVKFTRVKQSPAASFINGVANSGGAPAPVATPVAAPRPVPPPRPAANLASEEQRRKLRELANADAMDDASLQAWIDQSFPGKVVLTLTAEECASLVEALAVPI